MKTHPILFKAEMVRAILAGKKTQTRRIAKIDQTTNWDFKHISTVTRPEKQAGQPVAIFISSKTEMSVGLVSPWKVGDQLWVRETFGYQVANLGGTPHEQVVYRASNLDAVKWTAACGKSAPIKWKPSIHMPRSASRITLEITGIRIERLQEINNDDAIAEGAQNFQGLPSIHPYGQDARWSMENPTATDQCLGNARTAFAKYFCKISGQATWDINPWVWVIEFQKITGSNI